MCHTLIIFIDKDVPCHIHYISVMCNITLRICTNTYYTSIHTYTSTYHLCHICYHFGEDLERIELLLIVMKVRYLTHPFALHYLQN